MTTETAEVLPVPSLLTTETDVTLETMVPRQMMAETRPTQETPAPSPPYMDGHAAPRAESGKPRLTKVR